MDKIRGFEPISTYHTDGELILPCRSTKYSAGYDFYSPEDMTIPSHLNELIRYMQLRQCDGCSRGLVKPYCIKTKIKAYMQDDEVLKLYIRSSMAAKRGLILANSVGIVDADYYNNPDNEGEIGFLVYNLTEDDIYIKKGEKIGQGIFCKYLLDDIDAQDRRSYENERSGGFGSTGR